MSANDTWIHFFIFCGFSPKAIDIFFFFVLLFWVPSFYPFCAFVLTHSWNRQVSWLQIRYSFPLSFMVVFCEGSMKKLTSFSLFAIKVGWNPLDVPDGMKLLADEFPICSSDVA